MNSQTFEIDQDILEKAMRSWGQDAQLNQVQEELAELIVAINKFRRSNNLENLVEEIGDVYIMLNQLFLIPRVDRVLVQTSIDRKLFRLKGRLENYDDVVAD